MTKVRVALITNIPSPYRIPIFERISKKVNLTVYFTNLKKEGKKLTIKDENREWNLNPDYKFKYKVLTGHTLEFKGVSYDVNWSVMSEITLDKYDVVIVGGYSDFTSQMAFLLCKLRGIPIILWSGNTVNDNNLFRTLTNPITKFLIRRSDAFIAYGTKAKEYLVSLGASPKKIFIAINLCNIDFFYEENERLKKDKLLLKKELNIKTRYNILFVGRLIEIKCIEYLIDAYKKLKEKREDVGLIIVGDGPLREKLEKRCAGVNNIYFIKFVQPFQLPIYYCISDIFVLPSFFDRFGIVLSEAMASGLPIISTVKVGGSIDSYKKRVQWLYCKRKRC